MLKHITCVMFVAVGSTVFAIISNSDRRYQIQIKRFTCVHQPEDFIAQTLISAVSTQLWLLSLAFETCWTRLLDEESLSLSCLLLSLTSRRSIMLDMLEIPEPTFGMDGLM
ncbi:hypothetical protein L1987_34704 [Smallanthus sonchifolius]|uniref:Uncharacterized protein n=1 Tax=Smallanthus sonchifolius TaxID=185202 RepID=A0ACB9HW29_9ASTR|nr:hypothetical protein L1987_34704 [Smallanthus sonchifolius]